MEPSLPRVKVAAPPMAVLRALTTSPMVWPAVVVTLTFLTISPSGPFSDRLILPPAARPLASPADRPVAVMEGTGDRKRSFRPKNCEKPVPPREDGAAASSCTSTPLPPVAEIESWPLVKLAAPAPPQAPFSAAVKLPMVPPRGWAAPPFTDRVPAEKFTSMRDTSLPLASVTASVVLPLKFSASPDSRPVSRPVRLEGGG